MDQKREKKTNISKRSFTGALLLAFFLGWFGVHRMYVGKIYSGLLMCMVPLLQIVLLVYFVMIGIELGAAGHAVSDEAIEAAVSPILAVFARVLEFLFFIVLNIVRFYDMVLLAGQRFTDATGAFLMPKEQAQTSEHSYFTTLMLARFGGIFGLHRFYVGKPISGTLMAISLGGLGVWWLVDQILIMTQYFWDAEEKTVCIN